MKKGKSPDNVRRNSRVDNTKSDHVGIAGEMPGTAGGFTMAAFTAEAVPPGTKLYTKPQKSADTKDFYEWYERRYGKVDRTNVLENAQMVDALEVWNAALSSVRSSEEKDTRYAGWVKDLIEKPALIPHGSVIVPHGVLTAILNLLKRDAEEGRVVRGELAEELESSIIKTGE
jgi:hypothetical protein